MAVVARPSTPAPRRTLRSYARNSRPVPLRATEAAGDPIVNSDEDNKSKSPITSKMTRKEMDDVWIPETPLKSKPSGDVHSESIQKVPVPSAAPTPSPALTPSPERDLVEVPAQKKSDLSDASVLDVSQRVTRIQGRNGNENITTKQPSSSGLSRPQAEVEKRVTRSRSKYGFRRVANNTQGTSRAILVTDDDDDDDEVISTPVPHRSRKRLQRNAPTSDDDVQEVKTPSPDKRRRTRSTSKLDKQLPEDPADNLELQAILSNAVDEASTTKMIMEWGTKEGRAKLRKLYGSHDDDEENVRRSKRITRNAAELNDTGNETESDEEALSVRKKRKKRKAASAQVSTDDSDPEESLFESPATRARRNANGVRTRRQIASIAKKQRPMRTKSKSVPLPKVGGLLRSRLKSRKVLSAQSARRSSKRSRETESHDDNKSHPKLRRSKRRLARRGASARSTYAEDETDTDNKHDKDFQNLDDTIKQLSDLDDESEGEEVVAMELEEVEESVGSEEDDDEVEEVISEEGEDDDDDDDDDEDVESEDLFEDKDEIRRPRSRRKMNGRRKRTRPRNIFQAQGDALTAQEQQERLDFLVQQSATIAKDLHVAMAAQSGKHSDEMKNVNEHGQSDKTVNEKEEEAFVPPTGENCTLQPHQNEGIKWLLMLDAQGLNAILADEMGLGKTIQAISFLASLVISGSRGPHLVIAPRNVCAHWAEEVKKFYAGQITVVTHLGTADERFENLEHVLREDAFDIMVTSYELAARDLFSKKRREGFPSYSSLLRAFRNVEFEYLVVDEAHRLKNDNSKINIGIRNYAKAQRRLLLTGTPLSNNLRELWSLMNVLNPQIFSSKATFETWFSAPFSSKLDKKNAKVGLTAAEKSVIVDRLHTVIRPFFRRRVRADVCPTFTSADEVVIRCPMSSLQKALMLHLQQRATAKDAGLNNVVMAMRRVSNHPYIVSRALYDTYDSQVTPRIVASSGKFAFLYYALPRLLAGDHRVLIFSQFREVLDFLEDLMELLHIKFSRLDGMTSADARSSGLAEFNREGSDIPVFLLTTRAGGVGLNLQTADTVILFDSDWNPSADLQAVSRIQRIGQKKTVHILRLVTDRSVDDLIVEAARHKMKTQQVAVGAGKFHTSHGAALDQRMRQRDLEQLFQKLEVINYNEIDCSSAIAGAENGPFANWGGVPTRCLY
ncbi:DNA helicase [Gracilaria domingensis]|nr:DNA helicase [Gracilaria domingensis]